MFSPWVVTLDSKPLRKGLTLQYEREAEVTAITARGVTDVNDAVIVSTGSAAVRHGRTALGITL